MFLLQLHPGRENVEVTRRLAQPDDAGEMAQFLREAVRIAHVKIDGANQFTSGYRAGRVSTS